LFVELLVEVVRHAERHGVSIGADGHFHHVAALDEGRDRGKEPHTLPPVAAVEPEQVDRTTGTRPAAGGNEIIRRCADKVPAGT
jgi:hypothetical protein